MTDSSKRLTWNQTYIEPAKNKEKNNYDLEWNLNIWREKYFPYTSS